MRFCLTGGVKVRLRFVRSPLVLAWYDVNTKIDAYPLPSPTSLLFSRGCLRRDAGAKFSCWQGTSFIGFMARRVVVVRVNTNSEDVGSAVFGPRWPNENPVKGDGLVSVAGWPKANRVWDPLLPKQTATKKCRQHHAIRMGKKEMRDTHCVVHPYLWKNISHGGVHR